MLLKRDLENDAITKGLFLVNGEIEIDSKRDNQIEIPEQKDFLDFHVHVDNKLLFYAYSHAQEDDYIIPEDSYENYEETIQKQLRVKILEYNKLIKGIDFDIPATLLLYYLKEGFLFYHLIENEMICELNDYEEMLDEFVEEVIQEIPQETLNKIKNKVQAEKEKQQQELKELIFADPDFKMATNLNLRQNYTSRFFSEHPEYKELLLNLGFYHPMPFIENIWREFKERGLHK